MVYRSRDKDRFDDLCKSIQELKKEVNKRELERKAMADVVEQDSLQEIRGTVLNVDIGISVYRQ